MQNNKTMPEISGIPLLKWHLPNKEQDLTRDSENKKLKNENSNTFLNKSESIPFKCNIAKSSSCPTDSEYTEPNEENSESMEKNTKQDRHYLSDEIRKIGERLNYTLCVRNSNNDSTQSQKGSYNLRKRDKNIEFTGTQSRKSTSAQQLKKRVAKRKLPSDFSEEIICFKKGRKRENASIGDSQELGQSTNSTAQKLKRQFFKTETTLNEINQLILNWIRGTSKPLQRDEALTILETVKSTSQTLRDNQRIIKIDKTLEYFQKKPLQLYANKLQKDCEKLLKKLFVIIYECDMKHSEFTDESENKNESLPTVSTEHKKNLYANKKPAKTIKAMIKKTKNHFKKIINTHDKDTLSHRSIYLDQYKYVGDVHQNTIDMDVEETDCTNDFINDNISDNVKDFNLTEKFIVHDSVLSVETEMRDLNVEQNLLNKEIISAVEKQLPNINISKQLTQDFSDSQINNSENTNEQVANNPQNYLRNDQNVPINLINLKQVERPILKEKETTKLYGNSKKQSQREKQKQKRIFFRKKTDSETQKPIENVEIQTKQAKANSNVKTSKIEKARSINGESEVPQLYPFSVNCSSVQRNHKVGSQNVSKTYIHPAMGENPKNNTDLEIYNNTIVPLNNFQVQKQSEVIKEVKLLTQESLPTYNSQMTPISNTKPDVLNPLEYLRNDEITRYSIYDNNLKQTRKSILKIIHQPENTQLYRNNSKQSQHLANVERMNNISWQERSYLEPQKFSENVEILSKQINHNLNMITVQKQTPGRIHEKMDAWQKNSLPISGLETSSVHSSYDSCGMNVSKTYIQLSNVENLENNTNEVVNNNKMPYVNICQVPKQKSNKTNEFQTLHFLVTNGLDATSQTTDSTSSNRRDIQVTKSYNLKPSTESSEKTFIVHSSQREKQERAKAEIGPLLQDVLNITSSEATSENTKPIIGNLNFSEILTHSAINNTSKYNSNPLLINNKNNLNNNNPNDKLKPNQIQNHTKISNVNSLQMNPITVVGTQSNPYPNSTSIIPSIKQKSIMKIQAEEEGLLRRQINIANKIKDKSQDEASLESNQHRQNNAEQHSNFSNNGIAKRSTNFKTYKRKKINKEVSNEIRSEISQQIYQGAPLTVIQANNEFASQLAALEKTNHITVRDYDKSVNSKNDLKIIIDDSALKRMNDMETFSCLSLPAPTLSISQPLKVSNNSETDLVQKLSTDLKTTSHCLRRDLADVTVRSTSMELEKDAPKVTSSDINQNNQTTDINPNKHIVNSIVMEIKQDRKIEMKNKESQTCFATLLLNSDTSSNVVSQEKIQSLFSSDTIATTFDGIKSMRIKSKDEFVIIQDLKDLITADEFIW